MIGTALQIFGSRRNATASVSSLFALLLVMLAASAAQAIDSFQISLSEKEMKLDHPVDMMWDKWLMWDIGYQRMIARNTPYIELSNDSTSAGAITQFHITIGDNRFNFGQVAGDEVQLGSTTPGFNIAGSTVSGLGKELVVDIGNGGLLPGQLLRFKIKLDVDPSFAAQYAASFGASQPDFRTVLFDMNGVNVYDGTFDVSSDDNSQAYVVYNPGGKSSVTTFEDPRVPAGQYFNNNLRDYKAMDPVLIFATEGQLIPEPGSICLAMFGLSAGLFVRRRSRASAAV